jgi:chromosomal replication initiator protein
MADFEPTLWRDIMGYLRQRHAVICRKWFEELKPTDFNGGVLKICTSNKIQQNYLKRECLDQFNEAVQSSTGALVAVQFITGEQVENEAIRADATAVAVAELPVKSAGYPGNPGFADSAHSTRAVVPSRHHDDEFENEYDQIVLSPDYSFDNFITGPTNHLAYAASVAVANQPGTAYNPLFIHGGVGLGKTHLLQAICQNLMHDNPQVHICYLSCDTFMNHFIDRVQSGQMSEFRNHYRHVDVLVIDDIHILANRERTQEEFFHTFNALYQSNKQIVLSSDSPPSEIPQLEERLISRFSWGLVAHITRPDYETRVAIVRAKAKLRGLQMPEDVVSYVAKRIESNARELEGAITTIQGNAALQTQPITLSLAQQALGDPVGSEMSGQTTLQQIIDVVTNYYSVKLSDLQSKRRHKSITEPRQVCMWLARRRTRFSLEEIGGYFGGRDHTTVMHAIKTVDERMELKSVFAQEIEELRDRLTRIM